MTRESGSTLCMKKGSRLSEQPKQATNYSQISSYWTQRQRNVSKTSTNFRHDIVSQVGDRLSENPKPRMTLILMNYIIKACSPDNHKGDIQRQYRKHEKNRTSKSPLHVYNHALFELKTLTLQQRQRQRQRSDPSQKSP